MVNSHRWTFGGLRSGRPSQQNGEQRRPSQERGRVVESGNHGSVQEKPVVTQRVIEGPSSRLMRGLSLLDDDDGSEMSEMVTPGPPIFSDADIARAAQERRESSRVVFVMPERKASLLGKAQTLAERQAKLKVSGDGMTIVSNSGIEDDVFFHEFKTAKLGLRIGIGRRALDKTPIAQVSAVLPECEIADKIEIGDEVLAVGGTKFIPTRLIDDFRKLQNETLSEDGPRPLGLTFKRKSRSSDYTNSNKAGTDDGGHRIVLSRNLRMIGSPPHSPPNKPLPYLPQSSPKSNMLRSASSPRSSRRVRPLSPKLSLKKLRAEAQASLFLEEDEGDGIEDIIESPRQIPKQQTHFPPAPPSNPEKCQEKKIIVDPYEDESEVRDEVATVSGGTPRRGSYNGNYTGKIDELERQHTKTKEALCAALAATEASRRQHARFEANTNREIQQLLSVLSDRDAEIAQLKKAAHPDPLLQALTNQNNQAQDEEQQPPQQSALHEIFSDDEEEEDPRAYRSKRQPAQEKAVPAPVVAPALPTEEEHSHIASTEEVNDDCSIPQHRIDLELATGLEEEVDEVKVHLVSDDDGRFAGFDAAVEEAANARIAETEERLLQEHTDALAELERRHQDEIIAQSNAHEVELEQRVDEIATLNSQLLRAKKALIKVMRDRRKLTYGDGTSTIASTPGSTADASTFRFNKKYGDDTSTIASTPGSVKGPVAFKLSKSFESPASRKSKNLPEQYSASRLSELRTSETGKSNLSVEYTATSEITLAEAPTPRTQKLVVEEKRSSSSRSRQESSATKKQTKSRKAVGPIRPPASPRQRVTLSAPGSPRRGAARNNKYTRWNMSGIRDVFQRGQKKSEIGRSSWAPTKQPNIKGDGIPEQYGSPRASVP